MDWLTEPFSYDFTQRALLAGVLTVVTTSLVGTWVVLRGLSFLGDALAHGVLPGIALAFLWGIDTTVGAAVSALVMVVGISAVNRRARLPADTGIGLLFVGMLALGVVIISRAGSFATDLTAFLFGDVLGVTNADLVVQAGAALVVSITVALLYRPFLVLSFNAQKAELLGLRPRLAHAAMLGLIALAVVSSFRAVGSLLVFGLLVAPPATALLLVRRIPLVMVTGVGLGVVAVSVGLLLSYHLDTAAGATMAATAVGGFFAVLLGRTAVELGASRYSATPTGAPSTSWSRYSDNP
ncbi:MAG: metal ABC transporter permease [Acidimicrobiia bacterium]|nr:metal ABC transporter permease [Acidimicrobiia bacterium]